MIGIVFVLMILIILILVGLMFDKQLKEGFDAEGLVFNRPPEWFRKSQYDLNDWLVYYEPDQLEKPECMHYRGNPKELNYLSSAYRFWRM